MSPILDFYDEVIGRNIKCRCTNCGSSDLERIDEERVRCLKCNWITDFYETMRWAREKKEGL